MTTARLTPGLAVLVVALLSACPPAHAQSGRQLRVCADPNNLPFSSIRRDGFENRIVERLAAELGADVAYVWWPQRRGFVRNTLNDGACDVVPGVPVGWDPVLTTRPYYRSGYVAVTRRADNLHVSSFDDPALRRLRIGVQLIGDNGVNTPPAHALARRGIVANVKGYTVYGDYRTDSPPARVVEAVAQGEIDVAFAWGPLAGYVVSRRPETLRLDALTATEDPPNLPMVFDMAMGVRKGDQALRRELDDLLERLRPEIARILADYGVPRLPAGRP